MDMRRRIWRKKKRSRNKQYKHGNRIYNTNVKRKGTDPFRFTLKKLMKNYCILYICFAIIEKMKRGRKMRNYVEKANLTINTKAFFIVALSLLVF